jgi:tripartite-type tricarboxylate transporter receptor subunit TctC
MSQYSGRLLGLVGPKDVPEDIVEKIGNLVGKICKEPDFQTKLLNTTIQMYYLDPAAYQANLAKNKEKVLTFFREEGMVKN